MTKKTVSASGKIGLAGKIPVMRGAFLRFALAMEQIARVSKVGCIKYEAPEGSLDYLQIADAQGIFVDADGRHLLAEAIDGPINIEKGGALPPEGLAVLHAAQHAWNALARLEHQLREYKAIGLDINAVLDASPGRADPNEMWKASKADVSPGRADPNEMWKASKADVPSVDKIAAAGVAKVEALMEKPWYTGKTITD